MELGELWEVEYILLAWSPSYKGETAVVGLTVFAETHENFQG